MSNPLRRMRVADNLDRRDMARLSSNDYDGRCSEWKKVFLIRSTKYPDKIAELRALSFVHACNLIGWRPRQVELISEKDVDEDEQ